MKTMACVKSIMLDKLIRNIWLGLDLLYESSHVYHTYSTNDIHQYYTMIHLWLIAAKNK